ncbi:hypothetical protein B0T17DRAFT_517862 [Bombardia bombarda]|uniref:RRM domain-containing protein n=1 Tax=Bombardia bombarda TaxID=252184 RepID=A0AA40CEY7_9PEZI|nr:hypothetical protein B0T17DRAFT_517862 [Bombardia bombarda]
MDAVTGDAASEKRATAEEKLERGFSARYQGDINNARNQSANIPPTQSCSLFLTNLPAGTTEKVLLDALSLQGKFGRVMQTHVTPAGEDDRFPTAAAKLIMAARAEAERVYELVSAGLFAIQGAVIKAVWNRVLAAPEDGPEYFSRTLVIQGPHEVAGVHRLDGFLRGMVKYDTQDVYVLRERKDERTIVWVFGSFRAQAQVARMAIKRRWPGLNVKFGPDPLDVGACAFGKYLLQVNGTGERPPVVAAAPVGGDHGRGGQQYGGGEDGSWF